ncbi:hypothetical protein C487_09663, partial [Natrinema pallidum DSM 3751]
EATSCRVAVVLDTLSAPCCFVRDAFYDTLMEANTFGGTVPTVIPKRDAGRHQRIADLDLRTIHDQHTAEAHITDWKFEDFLDSHVFTPIEFLAEPLRRLKTAPSI